MINIIYLLIVLVVLGALAAGAVAAWRSAQRLRATARDWLTDELVPLLHPAEIVPIPKLQKRCIATVLQSATITLGGHAKLPSAITLALSPDDYDRLDDSDLIDVVAEEIADSCRSKAERNHWNIPDGFRVILIDDPAVLNGRPQMGSSLSNRKRPIHQDRTRSSAGFVDPSQFVRTEAYGQSRSDHTDKAHGSTDPQGAADQNTRLETDSPKTRAEGSGQQQYDEEGLPLTQEWEQCDLIPLPPTDPSVREINLSDSKPRLSLGRSRCDIMLTNLIVSNHHADLVLEKHQEKTQWVLIDRGSTNGTYVNGDLVTRTMLIHGDVISLGQLGPKFVFSRMGKDAPVSPHGQIIS